MLFPEKKKAFARCENGIQKIRKVSKRERGEKKIYNGGNNDDGKYNQITGHDDRVLLEGIPKQSP